MKSFQDRTELLRLSLINALVRAAFVRLALHSTHQSSDDAGYVGVATSIFGCLEQSDRLIKILVRTGPSIMLDSDIGIAGQPGLIGGNRLIPMRAVSARGFEDLQPILGQNTGHSHCPGK
jgi:hypothetical protein